MKVTAIIVHHRDNEIKTHHYGDYKMCFRRVLLKLPNGRLVKHKIFNPSYTEVEKYTVGSTYEYDATSEELEGCYE